MKSAGHLSRSPLKEAANDYAMIIGSGLHALAISRALAGAGVNVRILSHARCLPANFSRYAQVTVRPEIASRHLVDVLLDEYARLAPRSRVVLFPTNDRMVLELAHAWEQLRGKYYLSWSECRDLVVQLQNKAALSAVCEEMGFRHPKTTHLTNLDGIEACAARSEFPMLVKPALPLPSSGFKTQLVTNHEELRSLVQMHPADLPFVVQEWIEGATERLHFCTVLAREGNVLCSVAGRKMESIPAGLGIGCVMETSPNPAVEAIAHKFVRATGYSGPISIEFKQGVDGRYVLIEPNVGRMEHCVDVVIQSGVNTPLLEFKLALGQLSLTEPLRPTRTVVWFDTERDIFCFPRNVLRTRGRIVKDHHVVFPYFGHGDPAPLFVAWIKQCKKAMQWIRQSLIGAGSAPHSR